MVFVTEEVWLGAGFAAARAGLAGLTGDGGLVTASHEASRQEGVTLARVGPWGGAPGVSRLVEVQFGELVTRGETATVALRWQAAGRGGGLFPALDADITLSPAGEQVTVLTVSGAYRPPFGAIGAGLDEALLHRVAEATIRDFTNRLAAAITGPSADGRPGPGQQAPEPTP